MSSCPISQSGKKCGDSRGSGLSPGRHSRDCWHHPLPAPLNHHSQEHYLLFCLCHAPFEKKYLYPIIHYFLHLCSTWVIMWEVVGQQWLAWKCQFSPTTNSGIWHPIQLGILPLPSGQAIPACIILCSLKSCSTHCSTQPKTVQNLKVEASDSKMMTDYDLIQNQTTSKLLHG